MAKVKAKVGEVEVSWDARRRMNYVVHVILSNEAVL